jgi:hypothetical protein
VNRFIRTLLFSLLLAAPLSAMAQDFPRLGGILIGSPHDYWDPAYQQNIAKLDVAILSVYPGWGHGRGTDMIRTVQRIKSINPKIRIYLYVIMESARKPASTAWLPLEQKVDSSRWWLYGSGSNLVLSDYGRDTYIMNLTNFAPADSTGVRLNQWFARFVANEFAKPNPQIDGFFTDNVFWKPRRDGDWNRDGRIDSNSDATVGRWFREGYRTYITELKKAMPGKTQIANAADWGDPRSTLTEYQGQWNGGVLEGIIGKSYSIETQTGGWQHIMARYRKTMAAFAAPKIGMFNQHGSTTDYQGMRYGLASCLMDDGYYTFTNSAQEYRGVAWFDEFNANLGGAVSPPSTTAWQSGVFRRDFQNGIALVNPKGNGQKTVTLDGEYVLIKGTQAPTVNTGARVRQVTLRDRDGLILMRANPVRRPAAPAAVQIETAAN